jgi:hypothetical protein
MTSQIKFEGYKTHGDIKINPFVSEGGKTHEGDDTNGYDEACMTMNDNLKTKNVCRDLKKLEQQFNVLCSTAEEENNKGNGDNNNKYNFHMNNKYMVYQTQDCSKMMNQLAEEGN